MTIIIITRYNYYVTYNIVLLEVIFHSAFQHTIELSEVCKRTHTFIITIIIEDKFTTEVYLPWLRKDGHLIVNQLTNIVLLQYPVHGHHGYSTMATQEWKLAHWKVTVCVI